LRFALVRKYSYPMLRAENRSPAKASKANAAGKAAWLAAMRWRRAVDLELGSIDLTFTQWLVLDAADELVRETEDAVSQNAIAARTELDKMTISVVVRTLEKRGWVDRAPAVGRPALRVLLTAQGKRVVANGRAHAETASKRLQQAEAERAVSRCVAASGGAAQAFLAIARSTAPVS
jgi:DNA-binding MarR family transcriptional regulator